MSGCTFFWSNSPCPQSGLRIIQNNRDTCHCWVFLSSFSGRYFKTSADAMKTIYTQAERWSVCLHHLLVTGCTVTAGHTSGLSRMKKHHYRISCSPKKEIPMACFIYWKLIRQHLHPGSLLTSSLSPLSVSLYFSSICYTLPPSHPDPFSSLIVLP